MVADGRGIQSIEVGGRILTALVKAAAPMMLRDLASAADLAPAQAHAYLVSYRRIGLVEQDPQTGQYRIGAFAMRLGMSRIRSTPILSGASDAMARLSRELGLMIAMVVWGPYGATVVEIQEGATPLNLNIRQGTLFSTSGTASGRLFAAFSGAPGVASRIETEFSGAVQRKGVGDVPDRARFDGAVARIRKQGYAEISGAPVPGINAVSAPVYDEEGNMALAMTLIGTIADLDVGPESHAIGRLLDTVRKVSAAAGNPSRDERAGHRAMI